MFKFPDLVHFPVLALAERYVSFSNIKDYYYTRESLVFAACPHDTPETAAAAICAMQLNRPAWIEVSSGRKNYALIVVPKDDGTIAVHRVEHNMFELLCCDPHIIRKPVNTACAPNWEAIAAGKGCAEVSPASGWDCISSVIAFSDKDASVEDYPELFVQGVVDLLTVAIVTSPLMAWDVFNGP